MKILKPKYFNNNSLFLKQAKQDFEIHKTLKTEKIVWEKRRLFFCNFPYSFRELMLIRQIKNEIEKSVMYGAFLTNEDIDNSNFYRLRGEIQYNYLYRSTAKYMIKNAQKNVLVIDLNNAYSCIALLFGFISLDTYEQLIALKERYREKKEKNKNINAMLGASFMTNKIIEKYQRGLIVSTDLEENQSEIFWYMITYFCDSLLRRICRLMKTYGDNQLVTLSYFVDGIFLNSSEFGEEFLISEFDDSFYIALKETYWDLIDKMNLKKEWFGDNPFMFGWKYKRGQVMDLKPEENFLRIECEGKRSPFFYCRRINERMFDYA